MEELVSKKQGNKVTLYNRHDALKSYVYLLFTSLDIENVANTGAYQQQLKIRVQGFGIIC